VASIPTARLQVYFIDNEDYFLRKSVFTDKDEKFYADNDERAIFFCKGVLETVKKLGWSPDVVHCNDWMSSLIPLYLKTTYKNDPMFKDAKSVFTIFDSDFSHKFKFEGLYDKIKLMDIEDEMLTAIDSADYEGFLKIGIEYSDSVLTATENLLEKYNPIFNAFPDKTIQHIATDEHFEDNIYKHYHALLD
jgi:starch synthase